MINKIFWDLDSTLIHTELYNPNQEHVVFRIGGYNYYTIIRPCAKTLVEFCRQLVGKDNVYVLTTSTREYASNVNRLADLEFEPDHIIAREDIENAYVGTAYGGRAVNPLDIASQENVLIDNLPPRENYSKTSLIGINGSYQERYLKVDDYYGVNFTNDNFEETVKEFLTKLHNYRPRKPKTSMCDGCGRIVSEEGSHENCDWVYGRRGWRQLGAYDG